jgi:acetoacetate decarboxylase
VKTATEVEAIEAVLAAPRFGSAQLLSVEFLSAPGFTQAVLPPPLEPLAEPRMRAMVGRWESNCVGDFEGGTVYVGAQFEGVVGEYQLAQYIDRDPATIFGREVFGEPKKHGRASLLRRGSHFRGWIDSGGRRLLEIEGEMDTDRGPFTATGYSYNFKSRPAVDGRGLQEDAILTRMDMEVRATVSLAGTAAMELCGGPHDPLEEIPVHSLTRATYLEADLLAAGRAVATTPAAVFAPYHHGRNYDWTALDTEARQGSGS